MDYLASRFGPQSKDMTGWVAELAAAEGLDLDFDAALTVNTLDAHRLLHLAADLGIGDAAKERLLRAARRDVPAGPADRLRQPGRRRPPVMA